ncbi:MAG: hypothetical protein JXR71_09965 [Bacteroidales bacterium]|nr:hypothetical protein [Bacteroidales bacterium]
MKFRTFTVSALTIIAGLIITSCSKSNSITVSTPVLQIGQEVSDAAPLSGSIKGTMVTGKTYVIGGNVTVNAGDTLLLQPGVRVKVKKGLTILVKGVFISLGSKSQPNWIGPYDSLVKTDQIGANPETDPAYSGYWTGIACDPSCTLFDMKWTHLEFTGGTYGATFFPVGKAAGKTAFGVLFQNPDGNIIVEDSWFYGSVDDIFRVSSGHFSFMRNTFEKCGFTGGDGINVKGGSIGDMAYNLCVGSATNATKASNKKSPGPQCDVNMYNNTYIDCGFRQVDPTGRGGSLNYEEGAKGAAFNNLIVNCRCGLRVDNKPHADFANLTYGYNYSYGDSLSVCDNFYPVPPTYSVTIPEPTDIPTPTQAVFPDSLYSKTYLYAQDASGDGIHWDKPYDGSSFVQKNNPEFVNFPLPIPNIKHLSDVSAVGNFDFRLQAGSPAIGAGTTDPNKISPLNATSSVTDPNLKAIVTPPGADCGCYQSNGTGNQH